MTTSIRAAIGILFFIGVMAPVAETFAEAPSPIGLWKTIDDATGTAGALVRIYEMEGMLFGRIEKLFKASVENPMCTACKDQRKNQPLIDLIIIRNIARERDAYAGGDILDPDSGSVYRCKMHLEQGGTRLIVRGFLGFSIVGRSQTWQRQT